MNNSHEHARAPVFCFSHLTATMNYLSVLLLLCLSLAANGFVQPPAAFSRGIATRSHLSKAVAQVERAPSARVAPLQMTAATGKNFWEGEWVCADCGYIYDVDDCGGLYLEQQPRGFVCPQCRGPRRRFAKKVGDKVGITQDGGDAPVLLFSFLGMILTVTFGFWFAQQ